MTSLVSQHVTELGFAEIGVELTLPPELEERPCREHLPPPLDERRAAALGLGEL
jgi:hypothetical protein